MVGGEFDPGVMAILVTAVITVVFFQIKMVSL